MKEIRITNTLGREKQIFSPIEAGKVGFYHCGPTVYWTQQIGNMFAMTQADFIRRSFEYIGYTVDFVRNYTDVGHLTGDNAGDADTGEDRMEKAARREQKSPEEIAQHYIDEFNQHLKMLNVVEPNHRPRATEYIDSMITLTQDLLDKGFAYQTDLAIYFDTSKKEDYYKLSGQKKDDLRSGAGHGDVSDGDKRSTADFALWFFKAGTHKQALQTWSNPFSDFEGFPGWHIECSAMIRALLGPTIDIHMGGIEHIPIHHTNEIAQSECANDVPLANYWVHNEHLLLDGKKMSKSEGTAFTLTDVVDKGFSPMDLRYFFAQAQYRSGQNFTWTALEASRTARSRLLSRLSGMTDGGSVNRPFKDKFQDYLADDFNIPGALSIVSDVLKSELSEEDKKATILDFDQVLGLDLANNNKVEIDIPSEIQDLLDSRETARDDKDWSLSDQLRDEIEKHGYVVKDTADGQHITKK